MKMENDKGQKENQNEKNYIPLSEAAKVAGYTPEYFNYLSRKGKLHAEKIGRNWFTTKNWLKGFLGQGDEGSPEEPATPKGNGSGQLRSEESGAGKSGTPQVPIDPYEKNKLRSIAKNDYLFETKYAKADYFRDALSVAEKGIRKIEKKYRRKKAGKIIRQGAFAFSAFALTYVAGNGLIDKQENFLIPENISGAEEDSFVGGETNPVLVEGVVLGEETFADNSLKSENFKIGQVNLGGAAIFVNNIENKPLEIIDVISETFAPKKSDEVKMLIRWRTNKLAISQIEYAKNTGQDTRKIREENYNIQHSAILTGLDPGTTYIYTVTVKDRWGNEVKSDRYAAYTGKKEISVFELIIKEVEELFGWAMKN